MGRRPRDIEVTEPALMTSASAVDEAVARVAQSAQETWCTVPWADRRALLVAVGDLMEAERGRDHRPDGPHRGQDRRRRRSGGVRGQSTSPATQRRSRRPTRTSSRVPSTAASDSTWRPAPVVVVAGPWNFPYAIPASGLVHAIAAGSAVIMKPAPETRAVAAHLVDQLVRAGVPEGVVQLACTPDDEVGQRLITHDDVDLVMLTGSHDTAELFHGWKPTLRLHAETSGKNALVITAAADIDQAIKDLVRSAFGHSGQKCSAASLAVVEASVYDDPSFHRRLADAVRSLRVGWPDDPATKAGPLIAPPSGPLLRALTTLEPGESWLVEPRQLDDTGRLWSPGVRTGVIAGSWFHLTECFGPVLGLMRAASLDEAIALQNATRYGLTGGIHSLDPREIDYWLARVHVGNAYVNRHITGAIVQRQPFGGWKASSIGTGHKPGDRTTSMATAPGRRPAPIPPPRRRRTAGRGRSTSAGTTTPPAWPARRTSCATAR